MQAQGAWSTETLYDFVFNFHYSPHLPGKHPERKWYTHPVPDFTPCNATHAYFNSCRSSLIIPASIVLILRWLRI
jgi:hypothetical protein